MTTTSLADARSPSAPTAVSEWLTHRMGGHWACVGSAGSGASHASLVFRQASSGDQVVVRLEPRSGPFPSYDVIAEGDLLRKLHRVGLTVPRVLADEPTASVCGSPFIVTEWVRGLVIAPGSVTSGPSRAGLVSSLLDALLQIQRAPVDVLRGRAGGADRFGRTFDDVAEQFAEALLRLRHVDVLVLDYARAWLASTREFVRTESDVLVHGDFRLGNLLWEPDGHCCILDWEGAHLGNRLFDLAWLCMGAVKDEDIVMGLVAKDEVVACFEEVSERAVRTTDLLWWQVAAAWIRGCTEARLLDGYLHGRPNGTGRDPQQLLWEFGSLRTDQEILALIERFETQDPAV